MDTLDVVHPLGEGKMSFKTAAEQVVYLEALGLIGEFFRQLITHTKDTARFEAWELGKFTAKSLGGQ